VPLKINGVKVGILEVGYLEEQLEDDYGPFLSEEKMLLDAVGALIGQSEWPRRP
jgi:hypothetical protein